MKALFNLQNLKCISFNKKEAWEFDPEILLIEVKEYLVSHNIKERLWENFI